MGLTPGPKSTKGAKDVDDYSGLDLVKQHIGMLAGEVRQLDADLKKLEDDHKENRSKILAVDKESEAVRLEEDKINVQLQNVWKAKDGLKSKQRNLVRKQQTIELERSAKWDDYRIKSALVKELQNAAVHGLYGNVKRSSDYDDLPLKKKSKLGGSDWSRFDDADDDLKTPAWKALQKRKLSGIEGVKTEQAVKTERVKSEAPMGKEK